MGPLIQRGLVLLCIATLVGFFAFGIDVARLPAGPGAVAFTDRSGLALGTILSSDGRHAEAVPLTRVAPVFLRAIVAAEDARFARHGAIDLRALLRATWQYLIFGSAQSGGSTIAMQLARLLQPTPSTIAGKVAQICTAERIAVRSSKRAILQAYVNRVPMGGNLYGVEAAARTYFGEPASDLDLAQAALLAAIPNDPTRLAPDVDMAALRVRQRYVLARMRELGEITAMQAARAQVETLQVHRHDSGIVAAAHALFHLYPQVSAETTRVRTTLDFALQRFVQAQTVSIVTTLAGYHVTDGAAIVVDNATGDVLAYVGSPDYFSDAALGRNDGVQALRQPGSALKPFTYDLALERGAIASTTILPDVPAAYAIADGKLYQPADYSGRFSGPVRVRYALANSLNVPAVNVLSRVGVQPLLDRLHALGFVHLKKSAAFYGLGLTLGSGEVSLWDLAQAYVAMARGGSFIPLRLRADAPQPPPHQVGERATWLLVTDMLADPYARVESFGSNSVLQMPFPAAVKTGTSSGFHDTWTVGFTRDYTVAVWVGNFDGSAMRGVSGVTGAGPLWNHIMLHLYDRHDAAPFDTPPGFVRVSICATTGHAPTRACPAVVWEWVRTRDLAAVRRPVSPALGSTYDAWLARDPGAAHAARLRIVTPRDGDIFILNPTVDALQRRAQRLALRAVGMRGALRWSVGGTRLALDADGTAFWPLQLGSWTIRVRDGAQTDRVTIHVIPPPHTHIGFTRP